MGMIYRKTFPFFMNYHYHYNNLITTRKNRPVLKNVSYEKHHIIMKSMGGSDNEDNIVFLTPREHFIAHLLLWKIHRNPSTGFAFSMMCRKNKTRISSRQYQEMREALSFSFKHIDRKGSKNSMWGKKHSPETIAILKLRAKNRGIGETNSRARELYQYNKEGSLIKKWKYAKECADFYKEQKIHISRGNISSTAKFNTESDEAMLKSVKGFIFSFEPIEHKFQEWVDNFSTRYWRKELK